MATFIDFITHWMKQKFKQPERKNNNLETAMKVL